MKINKIKFLKFLESIKTEENSILVESVIKGFTILVESSNKFILKDIVGNYNGVLVSISVDLTDVKTTGYPEEDGGMDSPSWLAGHEIDSYKASASLQPISPEDYESTDESPIILPETEFPKVQILNLPYASSGYNKYAKLDGTTSLESIVVDYIESNIDNWASEPDRGDEF